VSFVKVYRQIALGDLLLFSVLAVPVLGVLILEWVVGLNHALGLAGDLQWSPTLTLFLHLVGLLGAALACMRLMAAVNPMAVGITVCVKGMAAMLFAWAVWRGAPVLLGAFGIADLVQGGILLAVYMSKAQDDFRQKMSK
jgi:hypothetical protein